MHKHREPTQSEEYLSNEENWDSKTQMTVEPWLRAQGIKTPLDKITELYLAKSKLSYIPQDIDRLPNLTHLLLWKNRLKHLPDSICNLSKLEVLIFRDNALLELSEDICNLSSLRHLNVQKNRLKSLPNSLSKLHIVELSLSENRLMNHPNLWQKWVIDYACSQ